MPPKAKFSREQIVKGAFDIVRKNGMSALTARRLGEALGSSARPIFTVFESMDEVIAEVVKSAKNLYASYVQRGLSSAPAFKGVGTQYIMFAVEEPQLFILLFMTVNGEANSDNVLPIIDENYDDILLSVKNEYGLNLDKAKNIYMHMWIYTHGIATMCATRTCSYTGDEISRMMTEVFIGLLKSEEKK